MTRRLLSIGFVCITALPPLALCQQQVVAGDVVADSGNVEFPWNVDVPERPWEFVVIHHSATTSGSVESIHREHRRRMDRNGKPWLGIGYHFVIGNGNGMADGEILSSFRWKEQIHGAHSGSLRHNGRGIGICLIGDFEESEPTPAQRASVTRLIRMLTDRYDIPRQRVIGHNQIRPTACPGRHFPLQEIVEEGVQDGIPRISARPWCCGHLH